MDVSIVTVIIPVFNAERFVAEALDSVRRQDYEPLEVLVVDDGSSDASASVVAAIGREWPAVRLLRMRENRGPAAARNAALAGARGDLITFLDADDLMTAGRLRFQVDYLTQHGEVDVVVGTEQLRVEPGVDLPAWTQWPRHSGAHYRPMSMMARRTLFDGVGSFDESFRLSSDTEWTLRAEAFGVRTAHVDRVLVIRRIHGGNLTYQTNAMRSAMRRALLKTARGRLQRQSGVS